MQDLDGDTDGHVGDLVSSSLGEIIRISADFSSKIRSSPVFRQIRKKQQIKTKTFLGENRDDITELSKHRL